MLIHFTSEIVDYKHSVSIDNLKTFHTNTEHNFREAGREVEELKISNQAMLKQFADLRGFVEFMSENYPTCAKEYRDYLTVKNTMVEATKETA